ncbi:hypothetical protein J3459_006305 [Metarhizium acridum]|nr:hypothetical protein J3459_006305 [Metarhizium acridum]
MYTTINVERHFVFDQNSTRQLKDSQQQSLELRGRRFPISTIPVLDARDTKVHLAGTDSTMSLCPSSLSFSGNQVKERDQPLSCSHSKHRMESRRLTRHQVSFTDKRWLAMMMHTGCSRTQKSPPTATPTLRHRIIRHPSSVTAVTSLHLGDSRVYA